MRLSLTAIEGRAEAVRKRGIEPRSLDWQSSGLPLTDSRECGTPEFGRGPEVWKTAVLPLHQCRESTAALWCE